MNTLKNNVSLIGNLGRDPELKTFGGDNKLARFSVATNESYKNQKGEWEESTTWHNIVAWGKIAERCEAQLKKGNKIILQGRLTSDTYEKDGEKRYKTDVTLREFMIINQEQEEVTKKNKKA